jgi:hypothetical protein
MLSGVNNMYFQQILMAANILLVVCNILAIFFLHPLLYKRYKIAEDNRKNNSKVVSLVKIKLGKEKIRLFAKGNKHYVLFGHGEMVPDSSIRVDEQIYYDLIKIIADYKLESLYDKAIDSEYKRLVN